MVTRNNRIRWCGNNFTETATLTVSSEQTIYPKSNLLSSQRYKPWSPTGNFVVTSSPNNLIYIDSTAIDLTEGSYSTGTELAAHITTRMLAILTGAVRTCVYNNDYTFTFSVPSGSITVNLGTSSPLWGVLGFLGTSDRIGTSSLTTDQIRIHDYETIDWDLSTPITTTFFSIISKKSDIFSLSNSAELTLRGDNVPLVVGTTAQFERTLTVSNEGVMEFLDDTEDTSFRYWQLIIKDRTNSAGPESLKFGVVYLGDYITLDARGVARGFTKKKIDPSLKNTSESGAVYYKKKNKYWTLTNLSTEYLLADNRKELEQFFEDKGNHDPFFISIDPTLCASTELHELTKYVRFEGDPTLIHVKTDTYSMGFNVKEDL